MINRVKLIFVIFFFLYVDSFPLEDIFRDMKFTFDGNYIFTGATNEYDAWILKTEVNGDVKWSKSYSSHYDDEIYAIEQTSDDGFICAGIYKISSTGDYDIFLMKTDSLGDSLWVKTFGGSKGDRALDLEITSDGGFIIVGHTYSFGLGFNDVYLIRTDSLGEVIWSNTYGTSGPDNGTSVKQTAEKGFIITGSTEGELLLLKVDSLGNERWFKGNPTGKMGNSLEFSDDDNFIIAGRAGCKSLLLKTDSLGNEIWHRYFGYCGDEYVQYEFNSVGKTSDGGYILSGYYSWTGPGPSIYSINIAKASDNGDSLWSKYINNAGKAYFGKQTDDMGFIIGGYSRNPSLHAVDGLIIKTDSDGDKIWMRNYPEIPKIETPYESVLITAVMNDSSYRTFSIGNIGYATLIIDSLKDRNPSFLDVTSPSFPQIIPAGDRIDVTIHFNPDTIKFYYDTISIFSNDPYQATSYVYLLGRGTGYIQLSDYIHDFGKVDYYDTTSWCLNAYNISNDTITIDSIINSLSEFWIETPNFPYEIPSHDSLEVIISFSPEDSWSYNDTFYIYNNDSLEGIILVYLSAELLSGIEENIYKDYESFISGCNPNPFTKEVRINYYLPKECNVKINIFNILGQKLIDLENCYRAKGEYSITWDGKDNKGNKLPGGIYFLKIEAGDNKATMKLILLR